MHKSVNRRVKDPAKTINSIVKDSELVVMDIGTIQAIQWFKIMAISGKLASKRSKSAGYKIEDISYLVYETIEDFLLDQFDGPEEEFIGLEWNDSSNALGLPLDFSLEDYKGLRSQAQKSESVIKYLLKEASGAKANLRPIESVVTSRKGETYKRATEEIDRPERQLRIQSKRRPVEYISDIPKEIEQSLRFIGPEDPHGLLTQTYYEPEGGMAELLDISDEDVQQLRRRPASVPAYPPSQRWEEEEGEPSELQMRQIEDEEDFDDDFDDEDEWIEEQQLRVAAGLRPRRHRGPYFY